MPNQIKFWVPLPALAGAINLALGPQNFLGQFVAAAKPVVPLPDPGTFPGAVELIAATLDSGHGANVAPMPVMNLLDRWQLQYHGLVQRLMVLSLLRRTPAGCRRAPFVAHLEKSLKTSNAFLLGMLYARVSTDHWASNNGWGQVVRFWHYSVLESSAFNFAAITAATKAGNPDFLVQFSNGNWACVEAKGTLDGFDAEKLRDGMRQACKITQVSWLVPGVAIPVVAAPASQACSLAYFDAPAGDMLEVHHLDPPARKRTGRARPPTPLWFLEAGDFIAWQCATDQFRALERGRESRWPEALPKGDFEWAPWLIDEPIWVGAPKVLLGAADAIDWSLDCLGWLLPELRKWRNTSVKVLDLPKAGQNRLRKLSRQATERAGSGALESPQSRCWLILATLLERLGKERPGATWEEALSEVWKADLLMPVFPDGIRNAVAPSSMQNLWRTLDESQLPVRRKWRLEANLALVESDGASSLSVAETARGLLVVAYQRMNG